MVAYSKIQRWFFLSIGMAVFVILFGSVVRISGSGAGCGQQWPTCEAQFTQGSPSQSALIEATHRLSSGLLALLFLALAVVAFVRFPRAHAVRVFSLVSLVLVIIEAVVGMLLVRHAWVGTDASLGRAVVMAFHLVNTLLLLAATSASAFFCWPPRHDASRSRPFAVVVALALVAVLVVAGTGAVTALGDTVYPVTSAHSRWLHWLADFGGSTPLLQRARAAHPIVATVFVSASIGTFSTFQDRASEAARLLLGSVNVLFLVQAGLGVASIALSTPSVLQLLHLFVGCLTWIALVFLGLELWTPRISSIGSAQPANDQSSFLAPTKP